LTHRRITGKSSQHSTCDGIWNGYQCQPEISNYWGQYSPYFSIPSEISTDVPTGCEVTFAQILSRHGARDPTASHTALYSETIQQIQKNVLSFAGDYAFLQDYVYTLGADQLTTFGEQQMVNSGIKFYKRYEHLTKHHSPFFRSSGQTRVVESAQNFSQGYHQARSADGNATAPDAFPYSIILISEANGSNNTLSHGLCTNFENGTDSNTGGDAQAQWRAVFAPSIRTRLNQNLPGANLSLMQTIYMMDLCPFTTVASTTGAVSRFCALFSAEEWHQYDYYQSLGKYYGFGNGNALGPTQGVGFTNELIARMTNKPVVDHTNVNRTLDESNDTFPLGSAHALFADFSHDK
jgi:Histidine phosphatase superfamily (branch 2)